MPYLDLLEQLDPQRSLLTPRAHRALLWTGQSSWHHAGLFPDQSKLLKALFAADALTTGFPFHQDCNQHRPSPLWLASLRNIRQSLWCLHHPRYQRLLTQVLAAALQQTSQRLTLLTFSCGLEMLNTAFAHLTPPPYLELRIFALGPTCLAPLRLPAFTAIQGQRDLYSRVLYRGPVHHRVPCGHLDYSRCPETLQLLQRLTHP